MSSFKIKKCSRCAEYKYVWEFYANKTAKDGLSDKCKSCEKKYNKKYREQNKDRINKYQKEYREQNRQALISIQKEWRKQNKNKIAAKRKERYANDPILKVMKSLRNQTYRLGDYKNTSTIELVGCSAHEFWEMNGSPSIDELRDLHIDHVVPLSWFDLTDPDHLKVCCHYLNLQYLSSEDNISKRDRYMGSPDKILAYQEGFDIDAHVSEMLVIIDELN